MAATRMTIGMRITVNLPDGREVATTRTVALDLPTGCSLGEALTGVTRTAVTEASAWCHDNDPTAR